MFQAIISLVPAGSVKKLRIFSNLLHGEKMIIKAIINFKQQILTLSNTKFQKLDNSWTQDLKVVPDMISYSPFDLVISPIHNMQISSKQYRVKLIFTKMLLFKLPFKLLT